MRVCYFGWFHLDEPRNAILRSGMEQAGAEVVMCRAPSLLLPAGARNDPGRSGTSASRLGWEFREGVLAVLRGAYLAGRFLTIRGRIDAVVVAEFNHGLVPLARLLSASRGASLVVDFLVSLYDDSVNRRRILSATSPRARLRRLTDVIALRLGERILVDTTAHLEHYERLFRTALHDRARVIENGAPEWAFQCTPLPADPAPPLTVLFYGLFSPFHGIEHILDAARILEGDERVRFLIVGAGQIDDALQARLDRPPKNVEMRPPVPRSELSELIGSSDICLGAFGLSGRAEHTVPNKVWQSLLSGRPVITGDGPGPRSVLRDGEHALLVQPGSAMAIADGIRRLVDDRELAMHIAISGREHVERHYTSRPLGERLLRVIREVVSTNGPSDR